MAGRFFDTCHADYFSVMGHEISIADGDLAQTIRELSDGHRQIVLMYYVVGLNDREIGEIFGMVRTTVCARRNSAVRKVSGDYNAMQEVIRLFKPYIAALSMEDSRFNNKLFERLVHRLMFITWQFDMDFNEK